MEIRQTHCPNCGKLSVVTQDIEVLCDSALLVKLENRIQLCCQQCGWMDFVDIDLNSPTPPAYR